MKCKMAKRQPVTLYRDEHVPFFTLKHCSTSTFSYRKHTHEDYSLGLIRRGTSRFWYEGRTETVTPRSMVFLPPELLHACNPLKCEGWEYEMLFLSAAWIRAFQASRGGGSLQQPRVNAVLSLPVIGRIFAEIHSLQSASTPLEKESSLIFLLELVLAGDEKRVETPDESAKVGIIREYLQEYFSEKVTLDDLSAASGINKFFLIRLFKQQFKLPPHAYQTLLRINFAQKELARGESLPETALRAGFYDQSHFTKTFKSYTGLTPEQYQHFSLS
ncbi:MAG: AraC family transcriptional regulator [Sporomusaceae bacterium]|nr:AraC family transcriptional regulator [Sporomusaceae bacterium]